MEEIEGALKTIKLGNCSGIYTHAVSLPYIGKFSREKTFSNIADLGPFAKVFFANIACARNSYSVFSIYESAEVFSAKIVFSSFSRKFPPSKISRYTVNG